MKLFYHESHTTMNALLVLSQRESPDKTIRDMVLCDVNYIKAMMNLLHFKNTEMQKNKNMDTSHAFNIVKIDIAIFLRHAIRRYEAYSLYHDTESFKSYFHSTMKDFQFISSLAIFQLEKKFYHCA